MLMTGSAESTHIQVVGVCRVLQDHVHAHVLENPLALLVVPLRCKAEFKQFFVPVIQVFWEEGLEGKITHDGLETLGEHAIYLEEGLVVDGSILSWSSHSHTVGLVIGHILPQQDFAAVTES